jgi:hypothetical protein
MACLSLLAAASVCDFHAALFGRPLQLRWPCTNKFMNEMKGAGLHVLLLLVVCCCIVPCPQLTSVNLVVKR